MPEGALFLSLTNFDVFEKKEKKEKKRFHLANAQKRAGQQRSVEEEIKKSKSNHFMPHSNSDKKNIGVAGEVKEGSQLSRESLFVNTIFRKTVEVVRIVSGLEPQGVVIWWEEVRREVSRYSRCVELVNRGDEQISRKIGREIKRNPSPEFHPQQ